MKSTLNKLLAVACITTMTSLSSFAAPVEGILGRWKAENCIQGQGVSFKLAFNFTETTTELTVNCRFFDGTSLSTMTSAHADYSANEIFIQEQRQSVVDDGHRFCRATLQPARWTAYFDGTGKMVLFIPTPYQSQFTLVKDI